MGNDDAEIGVCKAAAREAGEKLATPKLLFAKTRISQQT